MARRAIEVDGETWDVYPSGRVSNYARDEFGIVFEKGSGDSRTRRVVRFRPLGAQGRDRALAGVSDARLVELFQASQPSWTSPEVSYAHRKQQ